MSVRLDHLILPVSDLRESLAFYEDVLGFEQDGMHGPFHVIRVSELFVILLTQFETRGGMHLAFSFSKPEFEQALARIQLQGLPFGDRFDNTSNKAAPAPQPGATGDEPGIYFNDPSMHLIEIRQSGVADS
ncbi:MAG: VOC family protein [Pseudomonadales bacterium]